MEREYDFDAEDRMVRHLFNDLKNTSTAQDLHWHKVKGSGQKMLIAEMSNEHLLNMLKYAARTLVKAKEILAADENKIDRILFGLSADAAEQYVRWFQAKFPQYLYEATLRADFDVDGIEIGTIMVQIRGALGRWARWGVLQIEATDVEEVKDGE